MNILKLHDDIMSRIFSHLYNDHLKITFQTCRYLRSLVRDHAHRILQTLPLLEPRVAYLENDTQAANNNTVFIHKQLNKFNVFSRCIQDYSIAYSNDPSEICLVTGDTFRSLDFLPHEIAIYYECLVGDYMTFMFYETGLVFYIIHHHLPIIFMINTTYLFQNNQNLLPLRKAHMANHKDLLFVFARDGIYCIDTNVLRGFSCLSTWPDDSPFTRRECSWIVQKLDDFICIFVYTEIQFDNARSPRITHIWAFNPETMCLSQVIMLGKPPPLSRYCLQKTFAIKEHTIGFLPHPGYWIAGLSFVTFYKKTDSDTVGVWTTIPMTHVFNTHIPGITRTTGTEMFPSSRFCCWVDKERVILEFARKGAFEYTMEPANSNQPAKKHAICT